MYLNVHLHNFCIYISCSVLKVSVLKIVHIILGVVKRNPLFFHSISCKNNGFLFTTPNINYRLTVELLFDN